jgi:hypothetical protein
VLIVDVGLVLSDGSSLSSLYGPLNGDGGDTGDMGDADSGGGDGDSMSVSIKAGGGAIDGASFSFSSSSFAMNPLSSGTGWSSIDSSSSSDSSLASAIRNLFKVALLNVDFGDDVYMDALDVLLVVMDDDEIDWLLDIIIGDCGRV